MKVTVRHLRAMLQSFPLFITTKRTPSDMGKLSIASRFRQPIASLQEKAASLDCAVLSGVFDLKPCLLKAIDVQSRVF